MFLQCKLSICVPVRNVRPAGHGRVHGGLVAPHSPIPCLAIIFLPTYNLCLSSDQHFIASPAIHSSVIFFTQTQDTFQLYQIAIRGSKFDGNGIEVTSDPYTCDSSDSVPDNKVVNLKRGILHLPDIQAKFHSWCEGGGELIRPH